MSEQPEVDTEQEQSMWNINPYDTTIELSQGKIRMRERVLWQGNLKVSKATNTSTGPTEAAWVYVQAESRDGASVKLTVEQAEELRNALDVCVKEHKDE